MLSLSVLRAAEDVENARRWTSNLDKVEKLTDGPPGKGTRYR